MKHGVGSKTEFTMLTHLQSIDAGVLVVSSGGAIAMMLKHILGYDAATVVNMNLQIRNASFLNALPMREAFTLITSAAYLTWM